MRAPSDAEFSDFVQAAWPGLYRTAWLLVGDPGLAEDLVQTSLAKTYASWGRVRDLSAARGYARTVMVNTASSWFRKRSWKNEVPTGELEDVGVERDATDRVALMDALSQLPPRQRAVVVLRFYEDLSVEQTAEVLSISPGTVKSQASHALEKLRTSLGDAFVTIPEGAHHA
ncbi:MAG: SigE family RNA polymerase sigma factor [Marmoricola sp.]